MKNTKSPCLVVFSILFSTIGYASYPSSLEKNFQLAGKNNSELKKAIRHYSTHRADSLKIKAAIFLIENMDAHTSYVCKS
jgi:molybdopterin synthase catalytic subunit